MRIVSFLCTYNDCEYLDAVIESFKWLPDKLYIIEGSWKSSQGYKNSKPRSEIETYNILDKHVDNKRVFLIQANEQRERDQRQIGLDIAFAEDADWCWMLDSDEVYTQPVMRDIADLLNCSHASTYGYRLRSYNFINSFQKWYDGNYWRIYRPKPNAKFIMDNDVRFTEPLRWARQVMTMPEQLKFYHYNYVKQNSEQFHRKMHYQSEQDRTFDTRLLPQYGYLEGQYRIPKDIPIYNFTGAHPKVMSKHPYFNKNIYNDKNIKFLSY